MRIHVILGAAATLLIAQEPVCLAQDQCKAPPLTREQVLEVVRKDALDRGQAWNLDKWNFRIIEEKCNYVVLADCCPELRGYAWSLTINRDGKVIERFGGR